MLQSHINVDLEKSVIHAPIFLNPYQHDSGYWHFRAGA